jgi:RHS repeat-associated protein
MMKNTYSYDLMNNVSGVVNTAQQQSGQLGGSAKQQYYYDNYYRLDSASGEYNGSQSSSYSMKLSYDNLHNITHKTMNNTTSQPYDHQYVYGGTHPHQATGIGQDKYTYDENGNQLGAAAIENFWDEENRLMAVLNAGVLSQYTYDADGERVIKSSGGLQGIWLNGAPAGAVKHSDNYSVYVNPYITCTRTNFMKHYFIDNQRIATKQGHGTFTNISFPQPGLTAGGIDYARRAAEMEKARIAYYASLGVSPGPPTDKNYWARPENSGIPAPVFVDSTAYMVPTGWPGNTTPPPTGPPIFVDSIPSNDSVKAGYGFHDPGHLYETELNFYHSDLLGSTGYVTNLLGEVSQHVEYSPFGETFMEEHKGTYQTLYLFNAKIRDEETGYYYYGTLYYNPQLSQWLSVDPLKEGVQGYGNLMGTEGNGSSTASSGNAAVSDVVFANDDAAGMALSSFRTKESKANEKSKKAETALKPAPGNKGAIPKSQLPNNQNQLKRGFRQIGGGAIQNSGMFFNHKLPSRQPAKNVIPARRGSK